MSAVLAKLSKAVDAFTDILTEDIDSKKDFEIYKYGDLEKFKKKYKRKSDCS